MSSLLGSFGPSEKKAVLMYVERRSLQMHGRFFILLINT
ncbi:Uncharacterized protein ChrSV_3359 [Chromobacterium vaccinii]|nr:Uncharacterized protein ChrSW_3359 [Chromobacterium vaccinii]QND90816.1 Uncharacterized protein ChrSV_3359 [Chromobacterium vaccinii]